MMLKLGLPRAIKLEVQTGTWVGGKVPPKLAQDNGRTLTVSTLAILQHIALRTAPPTYYGYELSQFWPFMRYLPALAPQKDLRLRDEWKDHDPHQKTLLSDDFGMGFASWVVCQYLGIEKDKIVNTLYEVKKNPQKYTLTSTNKTGPKKSPDFIAAERGTQVVHVFECKGTQDDAGLTKQIAAGITQKTTIQVNPPTVLGQKLVIGTFIPPFNSSKSARCVVADPPVNLHPGPGQYDGEGYFRQGTQSHIASILHLLGFDNLGNAVAAGEGLPQQDRAVLRQWHSDHGLKLTGLSGTFVGVTRDQFFETIDLHDGFEADSTHIKGLRARVGLSEALLQDIIESSNVAELVDRRVPVVESLEDEKPATYTSSMSSGTVVEFELLA